MPIKFQCAHCGAPIKAPDTHAGETLPCPKCGQPVLVMADPVPPPVPSVLPMASAPPAVAPPPPVAVFAVDDEEDDDLAIPEIFTRDPVPGVPPELAFVASTPPSADPFASPRTRSSRVSDVELQDVRVVEVRLAWGTVFWMVFQFYVCLLAISMVVGLVFFVFSLLLAAIGAGLMGSLGCVPMVWVVG